MTGAERGTAIHAFMQSVPLTAPPDLTAEVQRQTGLQLLDAALADKLDLDAVRPFFDSAVWRRIRLARRILRGAVHHGAARRRHHPRRTAGERRRGRGTGAGHCRPCAGV